MQAVSDKEKEVIYSTACVAARKAGAILREGFGIGKGKNISYKGRINPVTETDIKSEKAIVETIRKAFPEHDIITEESNPDIKGSPVKWIIDPLDGTVNYAHNFPFVAVSIGVEIDGEMETGVVYNPIQDEFFHARKGKGAFMNSDPIHVSDNDNFEKCLLATGFPYDIGENPYNNLEHFAHIAKIVQAIRRPGSAALDMCYTAMGRFDGYWELSIWPWDIAAGMIIIEEAGGKVSNIKGGKLSVFDNQILTSNGLIHDRIVEEIAKIDREVFGK